MPSPAEITSTRNPLVRRVQRLASDPAVRSREGRIIVEGVRMLEEAFAAAVPVELVLYDATIDDHRRTAAVIARARRTRVRLLTATAHVIAACSTLDTPQGILGVVERPSASLSAMVHAPELLVIVADRIQDPGNLGTIIRIADASGASGVIVSSGSVDPYNPKALRATMGSIFHLPVVDAGPDEVLQAFADAGVRVLVADQDGAVDYADADYRRPVAIVIGNEGQGADPRWRDVAAATVRIPLYGRAESLNVAVAAGLLLYEAKRANQTGQGRKLERGVDPRRPRPAKTS